MLPKIEASIEFVSKNPERKAIITHLDKAKDGILEKTGTIIVK
jgi:carbamate kinase